MLPEERKQLICNYINENQAASTAELMNLCHSSEATIRRDLTELNKIGAISKVHGGAVATQNKIMADYEVSQRASQNKEEKIALARYAAGLISDNDLVYMDAGTTTSYIIDYMTAKNVVIITNAISHALKITAMGYRVYLTGGFLKASTEALIGAHCYESLLSYHFSIGFFGTNGVSHEEGFTTPDLEEGKIKECAISRTNAPYVLCDHTKFHSSSLAKFANYDQAIIITTDNIPAGYKKDTNVIRI